MHIEINKDKNIKIEMKDQLLEAMHIFEQANGSEVNDIVNTPARPHLRDDDPECTKLSGE